MRLLSVFMCAMTVSAAHAQNNFQPYNTQGDNLIHVTTADFDGIGTNDYVVGMSIEGKVIAFQRPDLIVDPAADNRLWEYQTPTSFNIMIIAGDVISSSPGDEVLVPGTDGHLRILSSSGVLLEDWALSSGALYCADVGVTSNGATRIVTGGVDGRIYILDENGLTLSSNRPSSWGVIRRVVVGNYDGAQGDEVISFYDNNTFSGGNYFEITDLDTLSRPSYWGASGLNTNDVQQTLGWTDKQLPHAYDMDGDGDEELVGHWGVLHPENGAGTQLLSSMLTWGERLRLKQEYTDVHEDTSTGKYLLQQGVPGNFINTAAYPGPEMATLYGDDIYLVDYDTVNEPANARFRVKDYGYAHTLYHFTDGARLEDRNGGVDKLVLAGPPNGDDHFYVVDFSSSQWKADAKTINGNGVLGAVSDNLDALELNAVNFTGTTAVAGNPIWYIDFFASSIKNLDKTNPAALSNAADNVKASMDLLTDELFGPGHDLQRIHMTASVSPAANGTTVTVVSTNGLENYATALAVRGAHFCLTIGKGANLYIEPDHLADIFEASIHNGHCYMMARTKELSDPSYIDAYKPHMDAVIARAASLGVAPPKIMLCTKGSVFSVMTPSQASTYFPAYKDVFVPGVENSNVSEVDWSFAERAGLWLNGDVESWGCNSIGDNLTPNRVTEFGGMRNGHVVLRQLLSQYALGADVYRITSIQGKDNPLFLRDGTGPKFSSAYGQGIYNFLKLVEAGVYPNGPDRGQLKGVSPVAAALDQPNYTRLRQLTYNHNYKDYSPPPQDYVINHLACWSAYVDVPDVDLTAIMLNTKRRWENLLPTSPSGFVPVIPYADRAALESNAWCNRAYQTDGDSWDEFGNLATARDAIAAELVAQKVNQLFYVDNECFWQVTQQQNDPDTLFAVLMDSDTLSPSARTVQLKKGSATGSWQVFDQFGSQVTPLGLLSDASDEVQLDIPAGAVRILVLKKVQVPQTEVIGIAWHSPEATVQNTPASDSTPDVAMPGITGLLSGGRDVAASFNSTDGTYGALSSPAVPGSAVNAIRVRNTGAQKNVTLSITNNSGGPITLGSFYFDFGGYDFGPLDFELSYVNGSLSEANGTVITNGGPRALLIGGTGDYEDYSVPFSPALSDSVLADTEYATFQLAMGNTTNTSSASGIDNVAITVLVADNYDTYIAGYGLTGSNALASADLEPDGLNNFLEYALGGNPTTNDAAVLLPKGGIISDLGTNWLEYAFRRRSDYMARGLTYTVEANTNLITDSWTTNGVLDAGSGPIDAAFDSVTNRVSAEEHPEQFMRLRVE